MHIVSSSKFDQQLNEFRLVEYGRYEIDYLHAKSPTVGVIIPKSKGFRKLRFEHQNRGKRGCARIIYIDYCYYGKLYLAEVYSIG